MVPNDRGELRPPDDPNEFLSIAPELSKFVDFDFMPLMNKDSTNMVPADWTTIATFISEKIAERKYYGFVVAHGTDTMHFTAAALSFAFGQNLNVPVVLTGAQTVPTVLHGDARVNLLRACKVAIEDIAEVVISFGDFVFRGSRTQKKDERRFDAFESPAIYPIADITENILIHPTAKRRQYETNDIDLLAKFDDGIVQIGLIPGLHPRTVMPLLHGGCNGIVLQSFGAGNVPDWGDYGFGDFIGRASEKGIPVVITSQFPANSTNNSNYEPGLKAVRAGAIPTGNMTSSAATVKFRWVLAQVDDLLHNASPSKRLKKVHDLMGQVFVDEMDVL